MNTWTGGACMYSFNAVYFDDANEIWLVCMYHCMYFFYLVFS